MAYDVSQGELERLTAAVKDLSPQPRARRWVSLSFCILDAVWSIGANYDTTVVPLVKRVAEQFDVAEPSVPESNPVRSDPVSLSAFRLHFRDDSQLIARTNKQRTSTRRGISKAQAVLEHMDVLSDFGVLTIGDAQALFDDPGKMAVVDDCLKKIKGEGAHGIRRGYLWMLIGERNRIKPDRMVMRWFRHHDVALSPASAAGVIHEIVRRLNETGTRPTNAWEVDHALWLAGRNLPA